MKSNARTLQDWLDLASEQGWRSRDTRDGLQLFPPRNGPIITIHDIRRIDNVGLERLRSNLKRAGLKFPEDQRKERPEVAPPPNPAQPVTTITATPSKQPEPDLFALIHREIEVITTAASKIEGYVSQLKTANADIEQLRVLLNRIR